MKRNAKIISAVSGGVSGLLALGGVGHAMEINSLDATSTERTIIRWIDGDTVDTDGGRVRLIGIDAPELANDTRCNDPGQAALDAAESMAPAGSTVTLYNPASVDNTDRYGRYLRYVYTGWADVGENLIRDDRADARYDSRDGYDEHPKEDTYRELDPAGHPENKHFCKAASVPAVAEDSHDYPEPDDDEDHHPLLWWLLLRDGNQRWDKAVHSDDRDACYALVDEAKDAAGWRAFVWRPSIDKVDAVSDSCFDEQKANSIAKMEREAAAEEEREAREAEKRREENIAWNEKFKAEAKAAWEQWLKSDEAKSLEPGSSGGGSGYTGPRCYAPGGDTYTAC